MASLNTLRTRGGIIISVVICLALLAFLLQDLGTKAMGRGGDRTVGEIEGTKIDILEYSRLSEDFSNVIKIGKGQEQLTNEEQEYARGQAWNTLLFKNAFEPGMRKLGLTVSEAEQVDMVSGVFISPILSPFIDPATGQLDQDMLRNFLANVRADGSGRLAFYWESMKAQMKMERMMSKFTDLVLNGAFVTDLEVQYGLQEANNMYSGTFVSQLFSSLEDANVEISAAEIRKYYNENKKMFAQKASRDVEYVVFEMMPSQADMDAALGHVEEIAAEFGAAEHPMQYASLNSNQKPDMRYYKESQIDPAIAATLIANKEPMYGPVLEGDTYTMARLGEWKSLPDTLGVRQIVVSGPQSVADSLMNEIRSGRITFEQALTENSIDPQAKATGGDLGYFAPGEDELSLEALKFNQGDLFTMTQGQYSFIFQITKRTAPQRKVQVATITYKAYLSDETQREVYGQASRFLAAAGSSVENFQKAATEMALAKRVAYIRATDRMVNGMENSSSMINWAFNNNKGSVSNILEINGNYVVAVLTGVREEGIAPLEQVSADIESRLRHRKKGEMLAAKMQGSSVEGIAASLGAEVFPFENVKFAEFYVENAGVEPRLIGAFAGVPKNTVSRPVVGNSGVFVFEVSEMNEVDEPMLQEDVRAGISAMQRYAGQSLIMRVLEESSEIKDLRAKFY